ncbi:unnamed protein product [Adineta steineri]|uniref:Uncharacterized protein n=1 Tax=Adineta steineri TaxID=433720 RepID=A0A815BUP3_9BILA|nr:unnamed protein product [Adineta steineri]CAF3822327.1 unnamed protein product [Adineta steineri]
MQPMTIPTIAPADSLEESCFERGVVEEVEAALTCCALGKLPEISFLIAIVLKNASLLVFCIVVELL